MKTTDRALWGMNRTQWRLLVLCCVSVAVWIIFAWLVVPRFIESAYRGESFSFANGIIAGQAVLPVDHYLDLWGNIAASILGAGLLFWLLSLLTTSPGFYRRFVGPATPGTLGAIRMWTCSILLLTTAWDDLSSIGLLPLGLRMEMGLMRIFNQPPLDAVFAAFLTSESSLWIFQRVTELLLVLGAIGLRTRLVIPLCAICAFIMNGILREYSGFWHQNLVPIYVLAVLSFTPCGDGFSLDRLRRIYQGRAVPASGEMSAVYGWARYACWVPIALTYAAAGFSKLRADGFDWASAPSMRALLYEQTLYQRAGNFSISLFLAPAPDIVFNLLGLVALLGEALFITVLVSRIARRILPAWNIVMHVGIVFLLNIVFFDLMLLLLVFYDFTAVRKRIGSRLRNRTLIQVLFDGTCPLCRRTVRVLAAADLFSRIDFQDFRRVDLAEFNRRNARNLTVAGLEKEMAALVGSRTFTGFEAYRAIAVAVPALWPLAPWLFLPGVSWLGARAYRYVADHRFNFLKCDASCPREMAPIADATSLPAPAERGRTVGYSVVSAALVASLGFFWFHAIEFYPFTAVQMFTSGGGRTTVIYYKTLSHRASGAVSPFYLEDTLGYMSINSRYENLFYLCFGTSPEVELCRTTLTILGSAYNEKAPADERVTHLEIQRWKWNFASEPEDPDHGEMDASFIGEVAPPPADGTRVSTVN